MAIQADIVGFQVAGFADSSNRLGRPVISAGMFPPPNQVHVEGDRLTWSRTGPSDWVTPGNRMISDFMKLASANSTESFVKFAKRYGVFEVVQWPYEVKDPDVVVVGNKFWRVSGFGIGWEPIEFWRVFSRDVRALLRVAAELKKSPPRPGDRDDWRVLGEDPTPDLGIARSRLERRVNKWLIASGIRLGLQRHYEDQSTWGAAVVCGGWYSSGANLFGMIALQLLLLIAGSEALYACAGCGLPFTPTGRHPNRGQNSYCSDCGLDRALRDADRRRKDKMIEARRLHAEGAGPEEIASRLNVRSVASVRRWLKKGKPNVKKTRPG